MHNSCLASSYKFTRSENEINYNYLLLEMNLTYFWGMVLLDKPLFSAGDALTND